MASVDSSELAAVQSGDAAAFRRLTDAWRSELKVHCYRMLGSTHDAEDAVQETWIRAWRGIGTYQGRSTLRAWLYRIATNVCLDELERRPRRALPVDYGGPSDPAAPMDPPLSEQVWLEPLPDAWLAGSSFGPDTGWGPGLQGPGPDTGWGPGLQGPGPEARYSARESVTLAFTATLQLLPPKQRAVLLLRDVLGLEASEVGEQLELTVPSVNSALQRARSTLEARAGTAPPVRDESLASLLARYVSAWESSDVAALLSVIREDACLSMPPRSVWYRGRTHIAAFLRSHGQPGWLRMVETGANGQPAFVLYARDPAGIYRAFGVSVLTIEGGLVAESITFIGPYYLAAFDVPASL